MYESNTKKYIPLLSVYFTTHDDLYGVDLCLNKSENDIIIIDNIKEENYHTNRQLYNDMKTFTMNYFSDKTQIKKLKIIKDFINKSETEINNNIYKQMEQLVQKNK